MNRRGFFASLGLGGAAVASAKMLPVATVAPTGDTFYWGNGDEISEGEWEEREGFYRAGLQHPSVDDHGPVRRNWKIRA